MALQQQFRIISTQNPDRLPNNALPPGHARPRRRARQAELEREAKRLEGLKLARWRSSIDKAWVSTELVHHTRAPRMTHVRDELAASPAHPPTLSSSRWELCGAVAVPWRCRGGVVAVPWPHTHCRRS